MYDICLEHLSNNGRLVTEIKNNVRDIKSFVPHKLDSHICVITDHCNDLTGDKFGKGETFYAIEKWCRNYSARNLSKKANVTCFQVLQQALDKTQYTSKGKVVVSKLEPSKEGLGDNKQVYRSLDILLGLFAPSFFELEEYNGWDITKLGHNYRALLLLKNRDGKPRGKLDLIIKGNTFDFLEIPQARTDGSNILQMNEIYEKWHY